MNKVDSLFRKIVNIEEKFIIEFEDENLVMDRYLTMQSLYDYVENLIAQKVEL